MATVDNYLLDISACRICYPCDEPQPNLEKVSALQLPPGFNHILCTPNKKASSNYDGLALRSQCKSNEEAELWLSAYSTSSGTTWNVLQTEPEKMTKYVFKRVYRCTIIPSKNQLKKGAHRKQCQAKVTIIVIKPRSQKIHNDLHLPEYPMMIRFNSRHNHQLSCLPCWDEANDVVLTQLVTLTPSLEGFDVNALMADPDDVNHYEYDVSRVHNKLNGCPGEPVKKKPRLTPSACAVAKQREVNPQLITKFEELYRHKHSPDTALATHIHDLQLEHRDRWQEMCEDRFFCPGKAWCNKIYKSLSLDHSTLLIKSISDLFSHYSCASQPDDYCCSLLELHDGNFAGVIVTPLMRRNRHLNPRSSDVVYVSSLVSRTASLYLLVCDSPGGGGGGGLPLAALLTSTCTEICVTAALSLYKSATNHSPRVFMAEDTVALRGALYTVYPAAHVYWSLYHVLRAAWLFALNRANGIPDTHQVYLYQLVLNMVTCTTELALLIQVRAAAEQSKVSESFTRYIDTLYERRKEWAVCCWDPVTRNGNTLESGLRIMKDVVLLRMNGFNTLQLAHFVLSRLDGYYCRRLLDLADRGTVARQVYGPPAKDSACPIDVEKVSHLLLDIYVVESARGDSDYLVNDTVGGCSCAKGRYGAACEHQHAVSLFCRGAAGVEEACGMPGPGEGAVLREIAEGASEMKSERHTEVVEMEVANDDVAADMNSAVASEVECFTVESGLKCDSNAVTSELEYFTVNDDCIDADAEWVVSATETSDGLTRLDTTDVVSTCDPQSGDNELEYCAATVSVDSGAVSTESGYGTNGSEHVVGFVTTELECATTEVGSYAGETTAVDCLVPDNRFIDEDRVNQCIANISNSLMESYSDDPALFQSAIVMFEKLFNAKRSKTEFAAALESGNFAPPIVQPDNIVPLSTGEASGVPARKSSRKSAVKSVAMCASKEQLMLVTECSVVLHRIDVQREKRRLLKKDKRKITPSAVMKRPWITSGKISKKMFIKNHGFALSKKSTDDDTD